MMRLLGYTLSIGAAVAILWLHFAHSSLTETQLFLRFWPLWLIITGALLAGIVLACTDPPTDMPTDRSLRRRR